MCLSSLKIIPKTFLLTGLISPSLNASEKAENRLSNAEKSCPDELELCSSVTSCLMFGVRTRQVIPEGTWMGPYQGTIVTPNDVTADMDTSYMWEVRYTQLVCYCVQVFNINCNHVILKTKKTS